MLEILGGILEGFFPQGFYLRGDWMEDLLPEGFGPATFCCRWQHVADSVIYGPVHTG